MSVPVLDVPTYPAAGLDRRFYAFAVDRAIAWSLYAAASWAAWRFFLDDGRTWTGVGVIVGAVLLVGLGFAVLQGLAGLSPGKAVLGLRAVHHGTGTRVGVGRALLRSLILGVAALPTFGIGVATLAWTSVMDRGRQRRGWHDHVARSIVVDVRPAPVASGEDEAPRHIVNLTAMRLLPAAPVQEVRPPAPAPRPAPVPAPQPPAPHQPAPPPPVARPAPRQPVARQPAPPRPPVHHPPSQRPPAHPPRFQPPPAQRPAQPPPRHAGLPAGPPIGRPAGPPAAHPAAAPGPMAGVRWRVTFDTGETFVVEGLALVGRKPEPRQGEPVAHVVPLRSTDMSLSKTHAQFHVAPDGVLVVMDRGSTNGSVLVRRGVSRELPGGRPTTLLDGDRVRFGDREMTVSREV